MTTTTWVDAGPFRAHLLHLMAVGDLSSREVATLAGISWRAADALVVGRGGRTPRRISRDNAQRLLNVQASHVESLRSCHVAAAEPRLRLLRLLRRGSTVSTLAAQLGVARSLLDDLVDGSALWCPGLLALRLVVMTRLQPAQETPVPASTGHRRPATAPVRAAA